MPEFQQQSQRDDFVQYVWNLNNPSDPDPVLSPIVGGGSKPLPSNLDYWTLCFNLDADAGHFSSDPSVVDYVEIDSIIITDNYRGWVP